MKPITYKSYGQGRSIQRKERKAILTISLDRDKNFSNPLFKGILFSS